jgi:hypothetical protein
METRRRSEIKQRELRQSKDDDEHGKTAKERGRYLRYLCSSSAFFAGRRKQEHGQHGRVLGDGQLAAEDTRSEAVRRVLYARALTTSLSEMEQLWLEREIAC